MSDWLFHGLVGLVIGVAVGACLAIFLTPDVPEPATPPPVSVELQPPCTTHISGVPVRC